MVSDSRFFLNSFLGRKIYQAGEKIILAGGKIILAGGKTIFAGGLIISVRFFFRIHLKVGKLVKQVGKSFLQVVKIFWSIFF